MLQEVFEPDFDSLKDRYGMHGAFAASSLRTFADGGEERGEALHKWGIAILTSDPIVFAQEMTYSDTGKNDLQVFHEWREGDGDLHDWEERRLLHVTTKRGSQRWDFVTTKFTWPPKVTTTQVQREDFKRMTDHLDTLTQGFVLGIDLNSKRGGELHTALAQKYRANVPLSVETTLDTELHPASSRGVKVVVDEIFTTPEYDAKVETVERLSDHRGLVASLRRDVQPSWSYTPKNPRIYTF